VWRSRYGFGKWLGYIDKFIIFPLMLEGRIRRERAMGKDAPFLVYICDHSNAMYTRWLKNVPHVVNCNDLLAIQCARGMIPGQKTKWTGRLLQKSILTGLRRAQRITCISDATRNDLLALAPELEKRSSTIELPLNYPYAPMSVEESDRHLSDLGCHNKRYVFHVGGDQWYKNREGVVRIFGRLALSHPDLKLIMAGKPLGEELLRLIEQENLGGKVIFTGTITNEQLRALYSRAEAVVFPSLKEGFGWPIIESQACGCPVVTSNRPPMNHIAGPAALLADPENPDDFANRLKELLAEDPAARLRRKIEAQAHAGFYDPQNFLDQLLRVLAEVSYQGKF
jgi:glycosyltransferase involved in cell wall biosynthesis